MPLKLLIADDEDMIRKGVAKYLQLHTDRFAKIYEAENGQEAIDLILRYQPDMLLLDVQMPVKTGLDVMKEVEKAGLEPVTVILSGYDAFAYAQQAVKFGAKDYLLKPVRAADILSTLNELADRFIGKEEDAAQEETNASNPLVREATEYIQGELCEGSVSDRGRGASSDFYRISLHTDESEYWLRLRGFSESGAGRSRMLLLRTAPAQKLRGRI